MIRFNLRAGFTLIEVLVAIAIIDIILSPLFIVQGNVLQNVARISNKLHRIFFAEQLLATARRNNYPKKLVHLF